MSFQDSLIVKRQREEDFEGGPCRPLTPESSTDEVKAPPPNKRHRLGISHGEAQSQDVDVSDEAMDDVCEPSVSLLTTAEIVSRLDINALRDIVTLLAAQSAEAQVLVEQAYDRTRQEEVDAMQYASDVDQILGSRSGTYATPGTAYAEVKARIEALASRLGPASSFAAKKNVLEALQDMALSILRADRSRQALELRAQFDRDDCIPQLMLRVVGSLTAEERRCAGGEATVYGASFAQSLQFVHEKAVENYVAGFYDFALVLEALK